MYLKTANMQPAFQRVSRRGTIHLFYMLHQNNILSEMKDAGLGKRANLSHKDPREKTAEM